MKHTGSVMDVLTSFTASWARLDGDGVADCLDPSATTTVIGTDPGEYTVGVDAYRSGWRNGGYPRSIDTFEWVTDPVIAIEGDAAWAHGTVGYDMVLTSGDRVRGSMWISVVLRRRGGWRIAHLHASYAAPPIVERG